MGECFECGHVWKNCDLIELEQFKTSVSEAVATYITERKVSTASEAAILADEFVLIHKGMATLNRFHGDSPHNYFSPHSPLKPTGVEGHPPIRGRDVPGTDGKFDITRVCYVCHDGTF